jgi:hypothetical protein
MHLTSEELVDIAEGSRSEASAPHLAGCGPCRAQLTDLRAMMSVARDVDVPEPSPLFWDHLSSRVSAAVAAEAAGTQLTSSRDLFRTLFGSRTLQVAVALAASLLVVVLVNGRPTAPAVVEAPGVALAVDTAPDPLGVAADDDDSLTLVASLTDGQDLETVREAGLAPRGSAEHAVTHMSDGELRELRRLLKEELTRPGA